VRSLLVPALAYDIGPKIWWPSKLGRTEAEPAARSGAGTSPETDLEGAGRR
jgi:RND superfamily putative drug exporter